MVPCRGGVGRPPAWDLGAWRDVRARFLPLALRAQVETEGPLGKLTLRAGTRAEYMAWVKALGNKVTAGALPVVPAQ